MDDNTALDVANNAANSAGRAASRICAPIAGVLLGSNEECGPSVATSRVRGGLARRNARASSPPAVSTVAQDGVIMAILPTQGHSENHVRHGIHPRPVGPKPPAG